MRVPKNKVAGSIQSPIFGGFLPLSIPILEKVDLVGLEMSTGICSKCGIEKDIEQFPLYRRKGYGNFQDDYQSV
jgi:hypothetical protein